MNLSRPDPAGQHLDPRWADRLVELAALLRRSHRPSVERALSADLNAPDGLLDVEVADPAAVSLVATELGLVTQTVPHGPTGWSHTQAITESGVRFFCRVPPEHVLAARREFTQPNINATETHHLPAPDVPAPTPPVPPEWATYGQHGQPEQLVYYGDSHRSPTRTGRLVTVTTVHGLVELCDTETGQSVRTCQPGTKFWAAPDQHLPAKAAAPADATRVSALTWLPNPATLHMPDSGSLPDEWELPCVDQDVVVGLGGVYWLGEKDTLLYAPAAPGPNHNVDWIHASPVEFDTIDPDLADLGYLIAALLGHGQQRGPQAGDAVQLTTRWHGLEVGEIGVLLGEVGAELFGSTRAVFRHRPLRDYRIAPGDASEWVTASGGLTSPPIPLRDLSWTDQVVTLDIRRHPADRARTAGDPPVRADVQVTVPLWQWRR